MSQIIILIILILLNAFFAATEIAFISLNDAKIILKAKEGDKKAKKIEKMMRNPSAFLATIQIGITLAGFLSSAFASDVFADNLSEILYKFTNSLSISTWRTISIVIITIILSYFILVFGELVPKRIGMKYSEKVARFSIAVIRIIAIIASPFVKLLTISTDLISKIFGVSKNEEETVTEEEIRMMVDVGQEKGTIDNEEKEMINNIFELDDITVSEIMIHRTEMCAVSEDMTVSELEKEFHNEFRYSRIPVYGENIDDVTGILYIKELLKASQTTKLKKIKKDAYFVPETKMVNELFKEMQKNKIQMAIVVDEYGGTAGIVTMEDVLEEIVGNMYDEYDIAEEEYQKIDENTYIFNGNISIIDLRKILKVDIPDGDYDTLSGYLLELLDRIPEEEEKPEIETENVIFKIEESEERRILKVKACKIEKKEENDEDEE